VVVLVEVVVALEGVLALEGVVVVDVVVRPEPKVSDVGLPDDGLKRGIGPSFPVAVAFVLVGAKPPLSAAVPVPELDPRLA
jgi:hypothetical protein